MKRKLLAVFCVTAMSAGLLAGCGSSDKTEESTKTEETAKEETSSQEETETKAASSDSDNAVSEEEAEKSTGKNWVIVSGIVVFTALLAILFLGKKEK